MTQQMKKEAEYLVEATQITVLIFDLVCHIEYCLKQRVKKEIILGKVVVLKENHEMSWTQDLKTLSA
jgi:hypothetical protein